MALLGSVLPGPEAAMGLKLSFVVVERFICTCYLYYMYK